MGFGSVTWLIIRLSRQACCRPAPLLSGITTKRNLRDGFSNPPDAAVVLCVDHKSQIQALDRTAPILPLLPGTPQRRTHDYRRYGTTNLHAALDTATGRVITSMTRRNRTQEFQTFLNLINREVPPELDVHVVLDNASPHKTEPIGRWLQRHPRFTFHFTPTYAQRGAERGSLLDIRGGRA